MSNFQYLTVTCDSEKWLRVTLTTQHELSTVTSILLQEFITALESAAEDQSLRGVLIDMAPINASMALNTNQTPALAAAQIATLQQLAQTLELAQQAGQQLQALNIPSIFLFRHSPSLHEMSLAMATTYCISSDDSAIQLAFRETAYGLHPHAISAQSAMRRMGSTIAMAHLATAAPLTPQLAVEKRLIDACAATSTLDSIAIDFLDRKPAIQKAGITQRVRALTPLRKAIKFDPQAKTQLSRSEHHYPAPYALLDLWKRYGTNTDSTTDKAYSDSIKDLSQNQLALNLFRMNQLKAQLIHTDSNTPEAAIKHVHLIGLGEVSGHIASCLLKHGINITFDEQNAELIGQMFTQIRKNLAQHFAENQQAADIAFSCLKHDRDGERMRHADLILLTQNLNLADSQELFAELEEKAHPDAILATHSSIASTHRIAAALLNPTRLLGLHFCQSAPQTDLVEIAITDKTDSKILEKTQSLIRHVKQIPLPLPDRPGLLADRVLAHYISQGIRLHQQGVPHAYIDRAGRDSGMPHGPLELADRLGLDHCLDLLEALQKTNSSIEIPFSLPDKVRAGKRGIKSGAGFYRYRNGNRLKMDRTRWEGSEQALREKLAKQIGEEAAICLEEGLLEDPNLIDIGIVFGTGYAPWQGGPLYQQRNLAD